MGVKILSTKVLIEVTILRFLLKTEKPFYGVIRATRSSSPSQGKESTLIKTLSIGPAPGIEPATCRSALIRRSTD